MSCCSFHVDSRLCSQCLACACSGDSQEPRFSRYKDFAGDLELDLKSCLLRDLKVSESVLPLSGQS